MKRLTALIISLLISTTCLADSTASGTYGFGSAAGGGGSCTTEAKDANYETGSNNYYVISAARGQSFQCSAGTISSIEVNVGYAGGSASVECRWGTSGDLSTYTASKTDTISETGWHKFTFDTKGAVSASTTYYFAVVDALDTENIGLNVNSSGAYASGNRCHATSGWDMDTEDDGGDVLFRVNLCTN